MEQTEIKLKSGVISLDPVTEKLGSERAKHLLNRCMFGARHSEIDFIAEKTPEEALDYLMTEPTEGLEPPVGVKESDDETPVGTTWVNTKYNSKYRGERMYSYNNWWMGRIINQNLSLVEKMTLFWHNHFVIENDVVRNTNYNYLYNALLYSNALGNFKTLVEKITVNTGMLNYLNGVDNKEGSPNENYARELFELFTIGKGPLIEEGNYTNYTEHDIREAAKVLTGWRTNSNTDTSYFTLARHDTSTKTFSEIYNNHTISNQGETEYKSLIDMIFQKTETSRYLVRKIYRWFVYHQIDQAVEQGIIEPLANLLVSENFEIKPILKKLLSSAHFYDENLKGGMIKNPLEFSVGMLRQLEFDVPDTSDYPKLYGFFNVIRNQANNQDLSLGNPPDVAGWPAWYLEPVFNQVWINTATIPNRAGFVKLLISSGVRPLSGYDRIYVDPFKVAWLASDPSDINILIPTLANLLFPNGSTSEQIDELKDVLIEGLPDFEWGDEWNKYINNPDDTNQKQAVATKLKNLLTRMCTMAEYQLI